MSQIVRYHCVTFDQREGRKISALVLEFSTFWQETQEEVLLLLLFVNLLDVWVLCQLSQSWPLAVIVLKASIEERKSLNRELERLGEVVGSSCNIFCQVCLTCTSKSCKACQHFVKDTSERPDIR